MSRDVKAGTLFTILDTWKEHVHEEKFKNKQDLLAVQIWVSDECSSGPSYRMEAGLSKECKNAMEWLSSLGYTKEEQRAMWVAIPGRHIYDGQLLAVVIRAPRR